MWYTVMGLQHKSKKRGYNRKAGSCLMQSLLVSMTQRECLDADCHVWCGLLHLPGLEWNRTAARCNMQQLRSNPVD
jgi:hypothetical protein